MISEVQTLEHISKFFFWASTKMAPACTNQVDILFMEIHKLFVHVYDVILQRTTYFRIRPRIRTTYRHVWNEHPIPLDHEDLPRLAAGNIWHLIDNTKSNW